MNPERPLVSVVVPVYNGERFLADAIATIGQQGYEPLEIVVVDDGSTDGTSTLLSRLAPPVSVIRQSNAGPASARNRGLERARGELLAFLDVDDLWPPGKLERQVGCLVDEPELDVVLGRIRYVALDGAVLPSVSYEDPEAKTVSSVHLGSGVFRRRAFEFIGGFDETIRFGEDHDWFLRAREAGLAVKVLSEVTLIYRLHAGNMTLVRSPQEVALTHVLRKSLERRRALGGKRSGNLAPWRKFGSESDE